MMVNKDMLSSDLIKDTTTLVCLFMVLKYL